MKGTTFKRCGCRDTTTGRRLGRTCPQLRRPGGGWSRQPRPVALADRTPRPRRRHPPPAAPRPLPRPGRRRHRRWTPSAPPSPSPTAATRTPPSRSATSSRPRSRPARPSPPRTRSAGRCTWTSPPPSCPPWPSTSPTGWPAAAPSRQAPCAPTKATSGSTSSRTSATCASTGSAPATSTPCTTPSPNTTTTIRRLRASRDPADRDRVKGRSVIGPATVHRIHATLRKALNDAIRRHRYIDTNPALMVELPRPRPPKPARLDRPNASRPGATPARARARS